MGGYNTTSCLRDRCKTFLSTGKECESVLEVHSSKISEGPTTRRVCGAILGPLASELTEIEVVDRVLEERIPLIN